MNQSVQHANEALMNVHVGDEIVIARTIEEADVRDFARITGDFAVNHTDAAVMAKSGYGRTMVHGALLVGLMSAASTELLKARGVSYEHETPVSLGFDRVRFVAPVSVGQTVRVRYRISSVDETARRALADVVVETEDGNLVAAGVNILKWADNQALAGGKSTHRGKTPAGQTEDARVLESLFRRRASRRAFLPEAPPRAILESILEIAQRSPSGCNSQPWKVTLCSGKVASAFGEALSAHAATATAAPDLPFPREYRGVYKERRRDAAWALFDNVGVKPGDRRASAIQNAENFRFFGAPHVAIITSDEALGAYGVVDCGIYVNSLLLAAEAFGLSAVPQGAPAEHSAFIRDYLALPPDRVVVCAVSFGYADMSHPANRTRTKRAPLSEVVTWLE
jgi:nitroreductase/acyl dehydratase